MNDPRIDQAFASLPLEELPENFIANTMAKIRKQESPRYLAKFKFKDFVLPGFLVLFFFGIGTGLYAAINQGNVLWIKELETEWAIFQAWIPVLDLNFNFVTMGAFMLFGLISFSIYVYYLERTYRVY